MRLSLTLMDGQHLQFQVNKDVATVGRSSSCDIVIPHEGMSRQHCRIEVDGTDVFITDLGSTNGVIIDGTQIPVDTRTRYNVWLPLAFGAVSSATIEVEEPSVEYSLPIELEIPKTRDVKKAKEFQAKKKAAAPVQRKDSKLQYLMSNILAVLVLIGAFVYYYSMRKSPKDTEPQAEKSTRVPNKNPAKTGPDEFY